MKKYESWKDVIVIQSDIKRMIGSYLESNSLIENYPHDMPTILKLLKTCSSQQIVSFLKHLSDAFYLQYVADHPAPYTDLETLSDIKTILLDRSDSHYIPWVIASSGYAEIINLLEPHNGILEGLYSGNHYKLLYEKLPTYPEDSKQELLGMCMCFHDTPTSKRVLAMCTDYTKAFVFATHYGHDDMMKHIHPTQQELYAVFKTRDRQDIFFLFHVFGTEYILLQFEDAGILKECIDILEDIQYPLDRGDAVSILEDNGRLDLADIINQTIT